MSPQNHQNGSKEGIYEVPHNEMDTVYDTPDDDTYYAEVPREEAVTSPGTYKKFDNPLYTVN